MHPCIRAAGAELPTSWDAVLAACPRLQQSGIIPIAFGGQAWQEGSVFVQILAGTGSPGLLRRFTAEHDPAASESPEMVETFRTFARLKPFVDKASPNRASTDTANLVAADRAALYFSGDWSKGDLNKAGMRPGFGLRSSTPRPFARLRDDLTTSVPARAARTSCRNRWPSMASMWRIIHIRQTTASVGI